MYLRVTKGHVSAMLEMLSMGLFRKNHVRMMDTERFGFVIDSKKMTFRRLSRKMGLIQQERKKRYREKSLRMYNEPMTNSVFSLTIRMYSVFGANKYFKCEWGWKRQKHTLKTERDSYGEPSENNEKPIEWFFSSIWKQWGPFVIRKWSTSKNPTFGQISLEISHWFIVILIQ